MTMTMPAPTAVERPELGDAVHMVCFQYLCKIVDELAGKAPIIAASRARGNDAITQAGMANSTREPSEIYHNLNRVIGDQGTRLCLVREVQSKPDGGYVLKLSECACSYGLTADGPSCSYSLGVVIGAVSRMTGVPMRGVERECQTCGDPLCVHELTPIASLT